jgi:hypothetical protein
VSRVVCLSAKTLHYPEGGGHLWVYLNWALGLQVNGCQVIWLEAARPPRSVENLRATVETLKRNLEPYGLANSVALCSWTGAPLPAEATEGCVDLAGIYEVDLLLNIAYGIPAEIVGRFRRTALLDIDPGLLQVWLSKGQVQIAAHDAYFSIGETVGRADALFPDCGLPWDYTPPCVALDVWPVTPVNPDAPFTTVTHWQAGEWLEEAGEVYSNDKKAGFLPFLDLPQQTHHPLELALCFDPEQRSEWEMLQQHGWSTRHAWDVSRTPEDYRRYLQQSLGEFSCVKPSCIKLMNAWISDRTICYLASGRPAVVQHTGPSRFLPDREGLFRFRDAVEAIQCLDRVAQDYENQSRVARDLAEQYFDARVVARRLLERALP